MVTPRIRFRIQARGRDRRRWVRCLAGVQCLTGLLLLLAPERVARRAGGAEAPAPGIVVRVLGARQIVQGLVQVTRPSGTAALAGSAVDASHALSMVLAAGIIPRYRRAALASATLAGATAIAGAGISRVGGSK